MGLLPIPLNNTGKQQAEQLGQKLKDKSIEAIFSSDLIRAKETTEIINKFLDVPISYHEGLREHSLGKFDGMSVEKFLNNMDTMQKFDDLMREVGSETTMEFVDRVWECFKKIVQDNKEKENILILSHGGCNRSVVCKILEASALVFDNLRQDNCCINRIIYTNNDGEEQFSIKTVNEMCHIT